VEEGGNYSCSLLYWGIREVTQDRIELSSFLILFYQYIHNRNRKLYSNYDSNTLLQLTQLPLTNSLNSN